MRSSFPLLEYISVQFLRERLPSNVDSIIPISNDYNPMIDLIVFPLLGEDTEVPETGGRRFDLKYKLPRRRRFILGAEYSGPRVDMALEVLAKSACWLRLAKVRFPNLLNNFQPEVF
jgi:hypothetical protein